MKRLTAFFLILCTLFTVGCNIKRNEPYYSASPYIFKDIYEFITPDFAENNIILCEVSDIGEKRKINDYEKFDKGLEYYYPIKIKVLKSYYGNLKAGDIIYIYSNGNNSSEEYYDLKKGFKGIINTFIVPDDIRKEFLSGEVVYNYYGNKNYVLEIDKNNNIKNKNDFTEKDFYYGLNNLSDAEKFLTSAIETNETSAENQVSPEHNVSEETGENISTSEINPTAEQN